METYRGTRRAVFGGGGGSSGSKQVREFDPAIVPYAEYALTGQGKQLRPALVALSAEAVGKLKDAHVTVAVIIEMVHLATLVHDDVMDEAEIRRGRLTLGANWGNEMAVLFGDCLFAQALKLAASFPTPEICRAVAMATNTVCSGRDFADAAAAQFSIFAGGVFQGAGDEDGGVVRAVVRSGGVPGRGAGGAARGVAGIRHRRSARRTRFMTIAWICSARRRRRASRWGRTWRRAS